MINLINGRGQLGMALARLIDEKKPAFPEDIAIYHTWNFIDKSEEIQRSCYEKFTEFVNQNPNRKIIFISTYSQADNLYNYYKQIAEAHLINRHKNGYVIRLPVIIGKGIFEKFRDNVAQPFGDMEIITLREAAEEVIGFAQSNSRVRGRTLKGHIVPAFIVKELIRFGKEGYSA